MAVSLSSTLYKTELGVLKVLPAFLAIIHLVSTILSLLNIDAIILSYIGSISFIPLVFVYLSSFVFKFCLYHRLPLYYIVINNSINIYDWYIGISLNFREMIGLEFIIVGIIIFLIIYLYVKHHKRIIAKNNK